MYFFANCSVWMMALCVWGVKEASENKTEYSWTELELSQFIISARLLGLMVSSTGQKSLTAL